MGKGQEIPIPTGSCSCDSTRNQILTASPKVGSGGIDKELANTSDNTLDIFFKFLDDSCFVNLDENNRERLQSPSAVPFAGEEQNPSTRYADFYPFHGGLPSSGFEAPPLLDSIHQGQVPIGLSGLTTLSSTSGPQVSSNFGPSTSTSIATSHLYYSDYSSTTSSRSDYFAQFQSLGQTSQLPEPEASSSRPLYSQGDIDRTTTGQDVRNEAGPTGRQIRPEVPEVPTDIFVDGIRISADRWAKAYIEENIVKAAMVLFEYLFSKEEICESTFSGRLTSKKLDGTKQTALLRTVWWMHDKREKNPYPQPGDMPNEDPPPEVVSDIKQKVFVEKRNEIRRKLRGEAVVKRVKTERRDDSTNQ